MQNLTRYPLSPPPSLHTNKKRHEGAGVAWLHVHMAFLSDATHRGLVGKHQPVLGTEYGGSERGHHHHEEEMVTPDEAGIQCTGEFVGGIRCMEVHRTPGSSIDSMRVWTGEQDGALCVRDGQGRGRFTVEKKRKVFVTALMCHGWDNTPGRFMYAGMSDGYLRVYDQVTLPDGNTDYEMICEHKKHTAAVTCMLSVRDLVITGGRDWQIFTWRWEGKPGAGGVFRAMDQLWGHQNAVRCLTYDQGPDRLLYSGGDDCSIKCIELETGRSRSVPGGFPIEGAPATRHGHRGGVRSLVVYERYLFSASEDGSVKVWDSQDGSFVNTMYKAAYSDAAVLALLKGMAHHSNILYPHTKQIPLVDASGLVVPTVSSVCSAHMTIFWYVSGANCLQYQS